MRLVRLPILFAAVIVPAMTPPGYGQGWTGVRQIDTAATTPATSPRLACGADGVGIVAFEADAGPTGRVYANRFDGSEWGGPTELSPVPATALSIPRIACGAHGTACATYIMAGNRLYSQRFDGTHWLAAERIDAATGGAVYFPGIVCDENGRAMAVYTQEGTTPVHVYANGFDGDVWSGPLCLSSGSMVDSGTPDAASNANGSVFVVWKEGTGHIMQRRFDGSGWKPSGPLEDPAGGPVSNPRVACDAGGNAVAVFQQQFSGISRICANRWNGSAWEGTPRIIDAGGSTGSLNPEIACGPGGVAAAVFQHNVSGTERVYLNRFDGSAWTGATEISAGLPGQCALPSVAYDSAGNIFVVFQQAYDTDKVRIWARRSNGTGLEQIDENIEAFLSGPQVKCDGLGNAIAIFWDSTSNRVYANRYVQPTPTPTPVIDLTANKTVFAASDRILVTADVQAISTPCYPFVRVVMADGSTRYYERGSGFTGSPTPYLGFAGGATTVAAPISGYPCLDAEFRGIAPGIYYLEGGAVDATRTTSADNLIYVGGVDREALTVQ